MKSMYRRIMKLSTIFLGVAAFIVFADQSNQEYSLHSGSLVKTAQADVPYSQGSYYSEGSYGKGGYGQGGYKGGAPVIGAVGVDPGGDGDSGDGCP